MRPRAYCSVRCIADLLVWLFIPSVSCLRGADHASAATGGSCSVVEWGAVGDGSSDDTEAFQRCWSACSTILVPAGDYVVAQLDLSGAGKQLRLLDGSHLMAPGPEARAKELAPTGYIRFRYGQTVHDWYTISFQHCTHCAIFGEGDAIIDGRAQLWVQGWTPGRDRKNVTNWDDPSCLNKEQCRPRLLGVVNSHYITLSNLHIRDSPFWTTHILNSSFVDLNDIYIQGDYNIANNDGIDVDSSDYVIVRNFDIDTADDGICIKTSGEGAGRPVRHVLVSSGRVASRSSAIKFGSETHGSFQNITIENIEVLPSHRAIGVQLRDQGNMTGITLRNIHLTAQWQMRTWWGAAEAIVVSRLKRHPSSPAVGHLKDMLFSNITGVSEAGVVMVGDVNFPIETIALKGLQLELAKLTDFPGGYRDLRPPDGPEGLEAAAPGALYVRNVREFVISDCTFKVSGGSRQRGDWGLAWQVDQGVGSTTLKDVTVLDER